MKTEESWNYSMSQKEHRNLESAISNGLIALLLTLRKYITKQIELERNARIVILLAKSGVSKFNSVFNSVAEVCISQKKLDGGWVDVEDSVWCVGLLKEFEDYFLEYTSGLDWLKEQQLVCGGWGKSSRDVGRIPITGVLLFLLPELANKKSLVWLENEWKKDFLSNPKLTYKAAFTLMANKSCNHEFEEGTLLDKTLEWLASQQNEDFGWGPWKGHPVGSTPFCTGVALTGLLQYPDRINPEVVANGLKWLERNQLPEGLWPDHYIEEGSIWSFYALTEGYKFLKAKQ